MRDRMVIHRYQKVSQADKVHVLGLTRHIVSSVVSYNIVAPRNGSTKMSMNRRAGLIASRGGPTQSVRDSSLAVIHAVDD
jgi:hypothetical protein